MDGGWEADLVELPVRDVGLEGLLLLEQVELCVLIAGREALVVPVVALDVVDADALLLVNHEDAVQQVPALARQLQVPIKRPQEEFLLQCSRKHVMY